jgi:hypothetical protein
MRLPGGRSIALFFMMGRSPGAVAFETCSKAGKSWPAGWPAHFLKNATVTSLSISQQMANRWAHHRHGEMALAYALHYIESNQVARLTNYGEYLEKHPPTQEVQIHEKSAWSCAHGVARWMADCGCNSGGHGGWNQTWRRPLREALDWLRDELAPRFEEMAGQSLRDPWQARNEYISVILDRSPDNVARFMSEHGSRDLPQDDQVRVLKLMELQRHAMLMYTSCGWLFDELSGIETVQVIQYAAERFSWRISFSITISSTPFSIGSGKPGAILRNIATASAFTRSLSSPR